MPCSISAGHRVFKVFTVLYSTLLFSQGSQILSGLSTEDHKSVLHMIKRAILATDLTVYMEYVKTSNVNVAAGQALCMSCPPPDTLVYLCLSF